jgi:AcrR family transcriptional regulator
LAEYRTSRRLRQAEATRRDIQQAARRLFAEHGYAATSVGQIAREADVAVQTIYTAIGSKGAVAVSLVDLIDAEADVGGLLGGLPVAETGADVIALMAHITRRINERCGDIIAILVSASSSEPDAAGAATEGRRRHKLGAQRMAARLADLGALREGVSRTQAAEALTLLTSSETWAQLRREHSWSFDRCERWITSALERLLL